MMGSCTTVQKTAQTATIEARVVQYPTVADLEVSPQKISASTSWVSLFSLTSYSTRKTNLTAEMLKSAEADVLVEPQYIHTRTLFNHDLEISGYPAKLKNFRKATEEDLKALRCGSREVVKVSEDCYGFCDFGKSKKKEKKKKFLLF